jgi:hypothetical protein
VKIDEAILANYLLYKNEETREDDVTLIFERLRSNGVHVMEGSAIRLASESGVYDLGLSRLTILYYMRRSRSFVRVPTWFYSFWLSQKHPKTVSAFTGIRNEVRKHETPLDDLRFNSEESVNELSRLWLEFCIKPLRLFGTVNCSHSTETLDDWEMNPETRKRFFRSLTIEKFLELNHDSLKATSSSIFFSQSSSGIHDE